MNLVYAVERLLDAGWCPAGENLERLPDGRAYPSVSAIRREFADAGFDLTIKHNLVFGCYRATWSLAGEEATDSSPTVIGACEREAAVYALAQLRESRLVGQSLEPQLAASL